MTFSSTKRPISWFAISLTVLSLLMVSACSEKDSNSSGTGNTSTTSTTATQTKTNSFTDDELRISFQYPTEWKVDKTQNIRVVYIDSSSSGTFRRNINLIKQSYPGTLDDYTKLSTDQFKALKDYSLLESGTIVIDGIPAHRQVARASQNDTSLQFLSVWTVKDNNAYVFTYTSDVSRFQSALPDVDTLMKSIKFSK